MTVRAAPAGTTTAWRQRTAALAALVAILAGCNRGQELDAPAPAITEDVDSLPPLPPSTIEAPVTYDLAPVVAELERAVPRRLGDINERRPVPSNSRAHFAFAAEREPFRVALSGRTARMEATIHYMGRGWYNPPLAPEVSGSCGTDGERPRARVEVATSLSLTPAWQLRGRTAVGRVEPFSEEPRDQCKVTFLKVDVTDKVVGAARKALEDNRRVVDRKIAAVDLRSRFEEWWAALQRPIHLSDSLWLQLNPRAVHVDSIAGRGTMLVARIGLEASPRVLTGPRPEPGRSPLPPLGEHRGAEGFHVLAEGVLDYPVASGLVTRELKGRRVEYGGRSARIRDVKVYGIGGGRLAMAVTFSGDVAGRIYFVGTPRYDAARDELYVPDLDFDVASQNVLVNQLEWLKSVGLGDVLRERARWPTAGLIRRGTEELLKGLNREIAPGVRLSGVVSDTRVLGVHASRRALLVRAEVVGRARMDIRKPES
ncbi:MAG TPA: DUF4403 family protein [Longimicrobiales bacterium]|nr:DUF4403 family protein [Longimicrobiales bacterium]